MYEIAAVGFTIFKLIGCPFSEKAVELATVHGLDFTLVEIPREDREEFRKWFHGGKNPIINAHNTFPAIFWCGEFVGGYEDLKDFLGLR